MLLRHAPSRVLRCSALVYFVGFGSTYRTSIELLPRRFERKGKASFEREGQII